MTIIYPEATPVQGNTKLTILTTVAAPGAVTLAELTAGSALDLSCFIRDWNPEVASNTGSAPSRLCTVVRLPVEGNTDLAAIAARYVYDPQAGDLVDENRAKAALVRGTEFYAAVRKGLDARAVTWAVGQRYELWRFRAGRQNKVRSDGDEFSEFEISQNWFPLGEPVDGVVA